MVNLSTHLPQAFVGAIGTVFRSVTISNIFVCGEVPFFLVFGIPRAPVRQPRTSNVPCPADYVILISEKNRDGFRTLSAFVRFFLKLWLLYSVVESEIRKTPDFWWFFILKKVSSHV